MNVRSYESLSAPMTSGFPEEWYDLSHKEHFWLRWRLASLIQLLDDLSTPARAPLTTLEVGCGTGVLRAQIEEVTEWIIDGADLNEWALQHVLPSRGRNYLYNVLEQRPEFLGRYDVVILFDVIEHIADPVSFMRAAIMHLRPGGMLLVNVPAFPALFSSYDAVVGHLRRYTTRSLVDEVSRAGDELVALDVRYWGMSLYPIAMLRRLLLRRTPDSRQIVRRGFQPPARWVNKALSAVMRMETAVLRRPWFGSSVMGAFRRI